MISGHETGDKGNKVTVRGTSGASQDAIQRLVAATAEGRKPTTGAAAVPFSRGFDLRPYGGSVAAVLVRSAASSNLS
jgi:hypothetical protein